jgi:hypothetical protein
MKPLHDLAEVVCRKFPSVDFENCKNKIIIAMISYRFALIDSKFGDHKEYAESLFDACCKARELLNALKNLDSNGRQYVMAKWDKDLNFKPGLWRKTCEWLESMSTQCGILSNFKDTLPSKPGAKSRTKEAETALLKALNDFLPMDILSEDREPIVRKMAIVIHEFTTGDKKQQKFRKLQKKI